MANLVLVDRLTNKHQHFQKCSLKEARHLVIFIRYAKLNLKHATLRMQFIPVDVASFKHWLWTWHQLECLATVQNPPVVEAVHHSWNTGSKNQFSSKICCTRYRLRHVWSRLRDPVYNRNVFSWLRSFPPNKLIDWLGFNGKNRLYLAFHKYAAVIKVKSALCRGNSSTRKISRSG